MDPPSVKGYQLTSILPFRLHLTHPHCIINQFALMIEVTVYTDNLLTFTINWFCHILSSILTGRP